MPFFHKAERPPKPRLDTAPKIAALYAGILILMIIAQLVSFTGFPALIESFWLPGGAPGAHFLAAFVIVAELFALPFLLRLKLSPLARITSMMMGWVVAVVWLTVSLWLLSTINAVMNIGFLGTTLTLPPGGWTVGFSLMLALLATWASYGMWPMIKRKK